MGAWGWASARSRYEIIEVSTPVTVYTVPPHEIRNFLHDPNAPDIVSASGSPCLTRVASKGAKSNHLWSSVSLCTSAYQSTDCRIGHCGRRSFVNTSLTWPSVLEEDDNTRHPSVALCIPPVYNNISAARVMMHIDHHMRLGVGHVFLYVAEQGWSLPTEPVYVTQINMVWLHRYPIVTQRGQGWQMNDCIHRAAHRGWEWVLSIDIDEFVFLPQPPFTPTSAPLNVTAAQKTRSRCLSRWTREMNVSAWRTSAPLNEGTLSRWTRKMRAQNVSARRTSAPLNEGTLPMFVAVQMARHPGVETITLGSRVGKGLYTLAQPPECLQPACDCTSRRCPNMSSVGPAGIGDLELCTSVIGHRKHLVRAAHHWSVGVHDASSCKAGECVTYDARLSEVWMVHLLNEFARSKTARYAGMPG